MHRRFKGAPTVELACARGGVRAVVAETFRLRLMGLTRLAIGDIEPFLIPRCRSIHMQAMKTAIDLVWLEVDGREARALEVVASLQPGRRARAPKGVPRRTTAALELPPGAAKRLGIAQGDSLTLTR